MGIKLGKSFAILNEVFVPDELSWVSNGREIRNSGFVGFQLKWHRYQTDLSVTLNKKAPEYLLRLFLLFGWLFYIIVPDNVSIVLIKFGVKATTKINGKNTSVTIGIILFVSDDILVIVAV